MGRIPGSHPPSRLLRSPARHFPRLFALLAWLLALGLTARAQPTLSRVEITQVDYSAFPSASVFVAPKTAEGRVYLDLPPEAFRVKEDGALAPIQEVSKVDTGASIAIVLDASGSINALGATGKPRREEAIEIIDELMMTDKWLDRDKRNTYVLLIVPKGKTDYEVLQSWTNDYVSIHNQVYTYDYQAQKTDTPLYAMLIEAIARMEETPGGEVSQKTILVLSDGVDRTSAEEIGDVIARANRKRISIMSIKLGPENAGQAKNLRRLSRLTNGIYAPYTGPESISHLFETLKSQASQYRLTYPSTIQQAGVHQVQVGVAWNGDVIWSPSRDVSLTVQPPQVRIVAPDVGARIVREGDAWDADPQTLEPRTVEVSAEVTWPDGHPRSIVRVSYLVDNVVVENRSALSPYPLDISALAAGPHTVKVEVEDALGMIASSDPVPISIDILLPPTPSPAPTPTVDINVVVKNVIDKEVDQRTSPITLFSLFALLLALLALALAIILFIRRPRMVRDMTATLAGVVKEATEVFIPRPGADASTQRARAYLIPVDGLGMNAAPIPITQRTVMLGRDPSRAQIVLPNASVSRLHASILEEEDGIFKLRDEGSTGGTYLNYQITPAEGVVLTPGDEIQLGRVRLIFQRQLPDPPQPPTEPPTAPSTHSNAAAADAPVQDQTSPFMTDADEPADLDRTEPFAD